MKLAVNDGELFYAIHGSGRPMMLMHGGLGPDHTYFRPWLDALGDVIQLIYYDHRGGGRSSRLDSFEGISHEMLVDDADTLRRHLGHEKIVLLGHSYGGMLALEYALRYQQHLFGLILCCTAIAWDYTEETTRNAERRGTAKSLEALAQMREGPVGDDAVFRRLWADIQPLYFHRPDPEIIAEMDAATHYSASAYDLSEVLLADFDLSDRVHKITIPTLIIVGRHDWVTPPSQAERIHELIPHADVATFEQSGHYPFIEEQDRFVEAVKGWVTAL